MGDLNEGMNKMLEGFREVAENFIQGVGDMFWDIYKDAGQPYGPNQEDMLEWLKDQQELDEIKREYVEKIKHKKMVIEFKERNKKG